MTSLWESRSHVEVPAEGHLSLPWIIVALLLVSLLLRFFIADSPFVNLESHYAEPARLALEGRWREALKEYQAVISNPPLMLGAITMAYGVGTPSELAARSVSLVAGAAFLLVMAFVAFRRLSPPVSLFTILVLTSNPLFWTYWGIAYADVPFVFVSSVAVFLAYLAFSRDRLAFHMLAAAAFAIAGMTKYNAAAVMTVVPVFAVLELRKGTQLSSVVRALSVYAGMWFLWVGLYGVGLMMAHGSLVNPDLAPMKLEDLPLWIATSPARLAGYLLWVGAFSGPLALAAAGRYMPLPRRRLLKYMALCLTVAAALAILHELMQTTYGVRYGEMQMGWVEAVLGPEGSLVLSVFLIWLGILVSISLWQWGRGGQGDAAWLLAWFLTTLLVHAFYRGAQRFSLFFLPPLALFLGLTAWWMWREGRPRLVNRAMLSAWLILSLSLGLVTSIYLANQARAAAQVVEFINEKQLAPIGHSPWNAVQAHSGYLIERDLLVKNGEAALYTTVSYAPGTLAQDSLFEVPVRLLGREVKRFAVICTPPAVADGKCDVLRSINTESIQR